MENKKKKIISEDDIFKMLNSCYDKVLNGIAKVSSSVEEFADDYLKKANSNE